MSWNFRDLPAAGGGFVEAAHEAQRVAAGAAPLRFRQALCAMAVASTLLISTNQSAYAEPTERVRTKVVTARATSGQPTARPVHPGDPDAVPAGYWKRLEDRLSKLSLVQDDDSEDPDLPW